MCTPPPSWGRGHTHRFTVEAARLIGQGALEDIVNPRGLRLVVRLGLAGDGGAVVLQAAVLLLLLLLLLQDVGHRVQQVVEELVGVLLHVIVKEVWKQKQIRPTDDATFDLSVLNFSLTENDKELEKRSTSAATGIMLSGIYLAALC